MRITVVTILPEMFESVLAAGVLGKAVAAGLVNVDFVNPRDFASGVHRSVDDTPYGGGPGMVMNVDTMVAAIESAGQGHRILLTPTGQPFVQQRVRELSEQEHLILVCGRYEGIDQRVSDLVIDSEVSVGDFVLTGGELAAMAVIDAVARYVPGVLGESTSADEESFSADLLEYPQYTRPASFRDLDVPEVLRGGNHRAIADWRHDESVKRTALRRPDLLRRRREVVANLASRTYAILAHHPIYDRTGDVVTSAVTNLDLHDIARSCATYGLAGYILVHPVTAQRDKVDRIVDAWPKRSRAPSSAPDHRIDALGLVSTAPSIEEALAIISDHHNRAPFLVTTSARAVDAEISLVGFDQLLGERACEDEPVALLFGTGWGLTDEVVSKSNQLLAPVRGEPKFNHLSVRGAVAIILDRLFGRG